MNRFVKCFARSFPLILIGVLTMTLLCLSACNGGDESGETTATPDTSAPIPTESPTETPTEPATESQTEAPTEAPTEVPTEPVTEPPVLYKHPSEYSIDHAGAKTDTVIHIADYGVVGDGRTDDGPAISLAVRDAIAQQATLLFEKDKTYCIRSATNTAAPFGGAFVMQGASGVTIDGNGSTFKFADGMSYLTLSSCSDIRVCNMVLDSINPVYLVGTVREVNGSVVTFDTDINPIYGEFNYNGITAFSIKYNEGIQARPHMFLTYMKKVGNRCVEVTYQSAQHGYREGDLVYLPNPGIGHRYSEVIYFGANTGSITLSNVQVCSAPSFVFSIKGNDAEMYFDNVDITPAETNTREIQMVSWRDGFHCKDNRRPMHWNECDIGVIFDDAFNISGTLGYVTKVKGRDAIEVTNYEFYQRGQNVGYNCYIGDVVDIYNHNTRRLCGTATVTAVSRNADGTVTLVLDPIGEMENLSVGCVVGNRMTCAPDSVITDCRFTGTFRFLRDIRIERTTFDLLAIWSRMEVGVEGPLPSKIDYVDCVFNGGGIEIGADSQHIGKYITGIGFWGCTLNGTRITTKGKAEVTESETWTESDLFTNADRELLTPDDGE